MNTSGDDSLQVLKNPSKLNGSLTSKRSLQMIVKNKDTPINLRGRGTSKKIFEKSNR